MALYRTLFERLNFSVNPPLKQTAEVLLSTDIPFDDEHLEAFEKALWRAVWEQNPHWADSSAPKGLPNGWSSVLGGHRIERIAEELAFAWYIPASAWLTADGVTTTVDVEEAARFTNAQILELQARYPGERYSMVMPKRVGEVFDESGSARLGSALFEACFDEWVLWGEGERQPGYEKRSPAVARRQFLGREHRTPFKPPEAFPGRPLAQEYERRTSWAWRLYREQGWRFAESLEAAEAAARAEALKHMRSSGEHNCAQWLAIRHNRRVEELLPAC